MQIVTHGSALFNSGAIVSGNINYLQDTVFKKHQIIFLFFWIEPDFGPVDPTKLGFSKIKPVAPNVFYGASPDTLNRSPEPPRAPSSKEKPHVTQQLAKKPRKSAGPQKSTKKRPGSKKTLPKMLPEAVFISFLAHLRSKSLSRSILGGPDPSRLCSHHSGSTILTKSLFSEQQQGLKAV